jgi:hypothetical protein
LSALTSEVTAKTPEPGASKSVTEPLSAQASRLPWTIAGGIAVLAIAGVILLRKPAPPPATPVVPTVQPVPDAFTVVFDSFPSGADVFDGEQKIGSTPMQLSLRNAGLDSSPKKFRIVRDGFLPYEVTQGQSREAVRVLATLAAEPREKEKENEKENEKKPSRKKKQPADEGTDLRTRR